MTLLFEWDGADGEQFDEPVMWRQQIYGMASLNVPMRSLRYDFDIRITDDAYYKAFSTMEDHEALVNRGDTSMQALNTLKITVNRLEVLARLKTNREKHASIVVEARKGYFEKARTALEKKLGELEAAGPHKPTSLTFSLVPPVDYTHVYDTAIEMFELHQGDTLVLDSTQVRSLLQDQWEWSRQFLSVNSAYSRLAAGSSGPVDEGF